MKRIIIPLRPALRVSFSFTYFIYKFIIHVDYLRTKSHIGSKKASNLELEEEKLRKLRLTFYLFFLKNIILFNI